MEFAYFGLPDFSPAMVDFPPPPPVVHMVTQDGKFMITQDGDLMIKQE